MKKTLILLFLTVAIFIIPFFIDHGGEYGGSDDQAEQQILAIAPDYEPGLSLCTNRPVVKSKVCCLHYRAVWALQ
ncbi:Additional substrate-specific component CbiN of cobalt ECF transporter [Morganella morganii IS15]|nr:Additional substrate-specific component CbiN of cobalt ECF transporter [Morganella morganii IS15]